MRNETKDKQKKKKKKRRYTVKTISYLKKLIT